MHYIEVQGNKITGKGIIGERVELNESQIEITEEIYNNIQLPSTFETDTEGNIINITPIQREPIIVDEEIDEEKIAIAEAIIDLDTRLSKLEGGN